MAKSVEDEAAAFEASMAAAKIRAAQSRLEHDRGNHQAKPKPGCFQCFRERIAEREAQR